GRLGSLTRRGGGRDRAGGLRVLRPRTGGRRGAGGRGRGGGPGWGGGGALRAGGKGRGFFPGPPLAPPRRPSLPRRGPVFGASDPARGSGIFSGFLPSAGGETRSSGLDFSSLASHHVAALASEGTSLPSRRRQARATPARHSRVPPVIHPMGLLLNIHAP